MNIDEYFVKKEKRDLRDSGAKPLLVKKWVQPKQKQSTISEKEKNAYKKRYIEYLNSKEWADIKLDLYQMRGKKCEVCGNRNGIQVHHLTYENIFNEEPKDLILLCRKCHRKEHR